MVTHTDDRYPVKLTEHLPSIKTQFIGQVVVVYDTDH